MHEEPRKRGKGREAKLPETRRAQADEKQTDYEQDEPTITTQWKTAVLHRGREPTPCCFFTQTERAKSTVRATESVSVDDPAGHASVYTRRPWCVVSCFLTGSHRACLPTAALEILGKAECLAVL